MVHPVIQRFLPYVNFFIATAALGFQVTVLYPWHYELQHEFHDLRQQQDEKLRHYHEVKMETIKNIEETLTELGKEKKSAGVKK